MTSIKIALFIVAVSVVALSSTACRHRRAQTVVEAHAGPPAAAPTAR